MARVNEEARMSTQSIESEPRAESEVDQRLRLLFDRLMRSEETRLRTLEELVDRDPSLVREMILSLCRR